MMKRILSILLLAAISLPAHAAKDTPFQVSVAGRKVRVHELKVSPADSLMRMRGMDDKEGSAAIYEMAAFCSFELRKSATVKVKTDRDVVSARILPASLGLVPQIKGREISFPASPGDRLTLEVNGDEIHSLHLFADPEEEEDIHPDDPDVLYYGPGEHFVSRIIVRSNQTLYIAPGAVLYGEMFQREPGASYSPVISLIGDHIKVRGGGIVDGSLCKTLTTNLLYVNGKDISIKGIILRDASVWTLPVKNSEDVVIDGVKILGYRANSDGIDICNSRNVTVRNCFIRTLDDLVVVKTTGNGGPCENIHVNHNVLWNEVAHALSIGAEITQDIRNVCFEDCDIIHDKGRDWSLRVYHCDQARVSDVTFRDIRIEESQRLISLWINKAVWSSSTERGHIDGVRFERIRADRVTRPLVQCLGYDASHQVADVSFQDIMINGRPMDESFLQKNEYTNQITIKQP